MGAWYEQVHTKNSWFQSDDAVCSESYYHDIDASGYFTVENTDQATYYDPRTDVTGNGYCPDATGQCYVAFGGAPFRKPNYVVIETDYETYSVVYCCDLGFEYVWLLAREPVASDELYDQMLGIAMDNLPTFNFSSLNKRTPQGEKCTYLTPFEQLLQ